MRCHQAQGAAAVHSPAPKVSNLRCLMPFLPVRPFAGEARRPGAMYTLIMPTLNNDRELRPVRTESAPRAIRHILERR
ncbi:hypothetical protein SHIRM173S_12490 [Streptomyces hirsutus]